MSPYFVSVLSRSCRTPQGVRGLKYVQSARVDQQPGRTPQGVRGLKYKSQLRYYVNARRTPQGVRGLKFFRDIAVDKLHVAPRKGCVD